MKKICSMILCLITLLSITAVPLKAEAQSKIYDNAGLLSPEKISEFEQSLNSFREAYNMDLVIATTEDAEGLDSSVYSETFYNQNEIGLGDDMDGGGLLMIDMDNREIVFFTSGKIKDIINDTLAQSITDSLVTYLGEESYDLAVEQFIVRVTQYVQTVVSQTETPQEDVKDSPYSDLGTADPLPDSQNKQASLIWPFVLIIVILPSLLIFFIGTTIVKSRYKKHSNNAKYGEGLKGNLHVTEREDHFIRTDRTQRHIPKSPPPPPPRPSGGQSNRTPGKQPVRTKSRDSRGGASSSFGSSSKGKSGGGSKNTGGGKSKF